MQYASLFQFMFEVISPGGFPRNASLLRQISREANLPSEEQLESFFLEALKESPLQQAGEMAYYEWVCCSAVRYAQEFHRQTFFEAVEEAIQDRLPALRQAGADIAAWEGYLNLAHAAVGRCLRLHALEVFESAIDQINWDRYQDSFIRDISLLIGSTYLEESDPGRRLRANIWLAKALEGSSGGMRLGILMQKGRYLLSTGDPNQAVALEDLAGQVAEIPVEGPLENLRNLAARRLHLGAGFLELHDPDLPSARKKALIEEAVKKTSRTDRDPVFSRVAIHRLLARMHARMESGASQSLSHAAQAEEAAREAGLVHLAMYCRVEVLRYARDAGKGLKDKEIKEVIGYFRKEKDNLAYSNACRLYAETLVGQDAKTRPKAHGVISELVRRGIKKIEAGGFFLINEGLCLANDLYETELTRPGISWMVETLNEFFDLIALVIEELEGWIPLAGQTEMERFRREYYRMEPASYHHIKTYFRYQFYSIKMLKLGALLAEDDLTLKQATALEKSLADPKNPLNFILADWGDEFKDVPHDVRNKTINRCITITKGDLPKAAEHLDNFSYRNLRSYITFNEVHRLGYFMDLQTTRNRQLEYAIRLLMHDLYESGTIFEVVFDMPRFLVDYGDGFFAADMEEAMEIKGTTAKKYINVMVEQGFLVKDKSKGRKHFFFLDRDKVMKRLATDSSTLIDPR